MAIKTQRLLDQNHYDWKMDKEAEEADEWTVFAACHGIDVDGDSDRSDDYDGSGAPVRASVGSREDALVLIAEFYSFAAAEQYTHTSTAYEFKVAHNSVYKRTMFKRKVFTCASHQACSYHLYVTDRAGKVTVEAIGKHGGMLATKAARGISKRLASEIDTALGGGAGPKKCLKMMNLKYGDDDAIIAVLPTAAQLKNRKQYLKKTKTVTGALPWEIKNLAQLQEWAGDHFCKDAETFFGQGEVYNPLDDFKRFEAMLPRFKNGLLVLECFSHDVKLDNGTIVPSFGVVFTSRRVLRNAVAASVGQGEDLLAMSDGTYKIFFDGWTLSSVGSCGAHRERSEFSRRYQPWAFIFVRTESTEAYTTLFRSVKTAVHNFFDIELKVRFGSADHAPAIATAFRIIWPGVFFLSCWPHFCRNAETKSREMQCGDLYDSAAKSNLQDLHLARSEKQFRALSGVYVSSWSHDGYAKWATEQYLTEPWSHWFASCSHCPGVLPNQNPIESYHRSIKETSVPTLRAMTTVVLNNTLPMILVQLEPLAVARHYCEGSIPSEMTLIAKDLKSRENHRFVKGSTGEVTSILYNAREYMYGSAGLQGLKVDRLRAKCYLMSLQGHVVENERPEDIRIKYLSLHQVTVLSSSATISHSMLSPLWSLTEVCSYCVLYVISVYFILALGCVYID
jgi:hypothetical protein